jgi:hypothetical protein
MMMMMMMMMMLLLLLLLMMMMNRYGEISVDQNVMVTIFDELLDDTVVGMLSGDGM